MKAKWFKQIYSLMAMIFCGCFPHQKRIDTHRESVERKFPEASRSVEVGGRRMHYVRTGAGPNLIVFIHGSPGSWDAFAEYMGNAALTQMATLISVDRLGFGKSEPMNAEKSLVIQCSLINQIIHDESQGLKPARVIAVGHSFGGPIAAMLAAEPGNNISDLLLLAASVDPDLEKVEWYQTVADWRAIRWLLPQAIDNANQEILPLRNELLELKPFWKKIRSRVTIVHGVDDSLVPVANVDYVRGMLSHNPPQLSILPNQGHFIPWEQSALITDILLRIVANSSKDYHAR